MKFLFLRDSNTSQATKMRNGSIIGPNKKPDIHIFYDGKILNWELLFGETSYGTGKTVVQSICHINQDHKKLMKFCKDAWDSMCRNAFRMVGSISDYMKIENIAIHSYSKYKLFCSKFFLITYVF